MGHQPLSARLVRKQRYLLLFVMLVIVLYFGFRPTVRREDQTNIDIRLWIQNPYVACGGNFTGYANEFALLKNTKLKQDKLFYVPCEGNAPEYSFLFGKEGTPLNDWLKNLRNLQPNELSSADNVVIDTAIAVMRYEAHNIYHTMTDWYNVFIVTRLLKLDPKKVTILFMDDRPPGLMDDTWHQLFGKVIRYTDVQPNFLFKVLVWNVLGYESPINFHRLVQLPFADDFYNFFISSFGIISLKSLDCSNLTAVIIWRRDYLTHPERKTEVAGGLVHRKFKNEDEILSTVRSVLPGHTVKSVVLEDMSMKDQLLLFTKTDILMGMHGAGMAHVMFLPRHAAVFEIFPNYWGFLLHFKAFSRWRGLKYLGWQNQDVANEYLDTFHTHVPPEIIRSHTQQLKDYLCKST